MTNGELLCRALGGIDEEMILDARRTKRRRRGWVYLVTAACCAALIAGAFAVGGGIIKDFFGSSLSKSQQLALDWLVNPVERVCTVDGTTMTISEAMTDGYSLYFAVRLTMSEGTKCPTDLEKGGSVQFLRVSVPPYENLGFEYHMLPDDDPSDNTISFLMVADGMEALSLETVTFARLFSWGEEIYPIADGPWSFNLSDLLVGRTMEVDVADIDFTTQNAFFLTDLTLSSFSIRYCYTLDAKVTASKDELPHPRIEAVTCSDGTKVELISGGGRMTGVEGEWRYLFAAPIDPKSVSSITIDGVTIPVNQ